MTKLPVDINTTYDDSEVDPSIALHQQHHDAIHAAVNNQVSKGDLVFDLRDQPGVVGDGKTDDSSALQAGLDAASTLGARAFANGSFRTTSTLRITGDADLSGATLTYHGSGTAVEVGVASSYCIRKKVQLPHVIAASKTRTGWGEVSGSVGVRVQNSYSLDLTVPRVRGFETGLVLVGNGNGTSYCNVTLGHLDNNKVNLRLTADATGWANQNNFYGGRLSHNSNEGSRVPGSRHILIDSTFYKIDANMFWGTSIESPDVVEYHLDCAGNDNFFMNCRWENHGSGARVMWRANSNGNVIHYGVSAYLIVETKETKTANLLMSRATNRILGTGGSEHHAVLSLENTYSASLPALRVMSAGAEGSGADQNTQWAMEISALKLRGKRASDAFDRVVLDNQNGRVYVGGATSAPLTYFGAVDNFMGFGGGSVCFVRDNTHDFGTSLHRPRYVRAATGVQTGAFRKSARPSPATAGIGTSIFDITLRKPIWSTGIAWVDATGKAV